MLGSSWVTEQVAASREGFSSIELVTVEEVENYGECYTINGLNVHIKFLGLLNKEGGVGGA
jgi:hypothetical protein